MSRFESLIFPELRLRITAVQKEKRQLIWLLKDIDNGKEYKFRSGSKTGPNLQVFLHLAPGEFIGDPEKYVGTIIPASRGQFDIKIRMGDNHQRPEFVKSKQPLLRHFIPEITVFPRD